MEAAAGRRGIGVARGVDRPGADAVLPGVEIGVVDALAAGIEPRVVEAAAETRMTLRGVKPQDRMLRTPFLRAVCDRGLGRVSVWVGQERIADLEGVGDRH